MRRRRRSSVFPPLRTGEVSDEEVLRAIRTVPTHYALALVQHQVGSSNLSASTVQATLTATGAGNLLVACTYNNGTMTVSSISDGTNNFTQFPGAVATNVTRKTDVWYLTSSTSGKTVITATFSVSDTSRKVLFVFEVSGVTAVSTDGVGTGAGNSATPNGAAVTTTGASGFIVGVCGFSSAITVNPRSGNEFTSGGDIINGHAACSLISTSAAAHQPAWDGSMAADYVTTTAAFKDSPPAGGRHLMSLLGVGG